ncbi:MAG: ABC transporter substrate-binding protein [Proteobacteria bacterium]|nr:ABC transporter substrate-binding protein [Pseudomonadota bacterium]
MTSHIRKAGLLALGVSTSVLAMSAAASAQTVNLRYLCYADANECEVSRELLDRFEKANPAIKVTLDKVGFAVIREQLETRLQGGEAPDMARVTNLGGLNKYYLDLSPYIKAADWETNFATTLPWMRVGKDDKGIYGFMTQITVTGPFVNKTMFDQTGVKMPGAGATWDDWAKATAEVQKKGKVYAGMVMDRSGHRLAGMSISMGAKYFDANGLPSAVVDDGFKATSERMVQWHKDGLMPQDVWPGASGAKWKNAGDMFINGDVVMHIAGSWMIQKYEADIKDKFEWVVPPQPCGPAACSAMPGGAAMVAFKSTKHPKEVAQVMEFMASEPVLKEYYERTVQIPAHKGLAAKGLNYGSGVGAPTQAALKQFTADFAKISPVAHQLQGYQRNVAIFNATVNYVAQAITGTLTLPQAYAKIQEEIDNAVKK